MILQEILWWSIDHQNHDKARHVNTIISIRINQPTNQPAQSILKKKKATNLVRCYKFSIFNETPQTAVSTTCLSIRHFDDTPNQ